MKLGEILTQQGHTVLATGHQQCFKIMLLQQCIALFDQRLFIITTPRHQFELGYIRRYHGSAAITTEVQRLGVYQYRLAGSARQRNQRLDIGQRALAII